MIETLKSFIFYFILLTLKHFAGLVDITMPTEARMETSAAGITTPYTPKTQKNQKSKENGAEPDGDDNTASDVSDAEIDESTLKAGTEHNANPEGKEEEDDNSLVVFHCWLCSVEFIDKVSIIRHLKVITISKFSEKSNYEKIFYFCVF